MERRQRTWYTIENVLNYVLDPASDSEISNLEESDVKESEEFVPVADDEGDDSTDDWRGTRKWTVSISISKHAWHGGVKRQSLRSVGERLSHPKPIELLRVKISACKCFHSTAKVLFTYTQRNQLMASTLLTNAFATKAGHGNVLFKTTTAWSALSTSYEEKVPSHLHVTSGIRGKERIKQNHKTYIGKKWL